MTGRITLRGIRGRFPRSLAGATLTVDKAGKIGFTPRDQVLTTGGAAAGGGGVPLPANPSATAKDTAVNGTATTYMTSDSAPAVQKCSSSLFGLAKVDGSTIVSAGGVISAVFSEGSDFAFPPITAPAAPASGFIVYCDTADNKLKAISSASNITVLALP